MTAPVFRFAPSPNGICTSAMPCPRCSISTWRAPPLGVSCCGSRISTRLAAGRNSRRRSTRIWNGSESNGTARCGGSPSISPRIVPRSANSRRRDWSIQASKAAPTSPASIAEREDSGVEWPRDPDGVPLYPGTAKEMPRAERLHRIAAGEPYALRLDMIAAVARAGTLTWDESGAGPLGETGSVTAAPEAWGDVILARKETPDQLSSLGHARRRAAGRDTRRARAGFVLGDECASAAASAAWTAGAGLSPPPADPRAGRAKAREINTFDSAARAPRAGRHPRRRPPHGRPLALLLLLLLLR